MRTSSIRKTARAFSIGTSTISRHAAHSGVRSARNAEHKNDSEDVCPGPIVPIESAEDVRREWLWQYNELRTIYEAAKARNDWQRANRVMDSASALVEKFAKMLGLYSDGPNIVLDQSTKVIAMVSKLTDAELRALARGEPLETEGDAQSA